jgi:hypothetical protein
MHMCPEGPWRSDPVSVHATTHATAPYARQQLSLRLAVVSTVRNITCPVVLPVVTKMLHLHPVIVCELDAAPELWVHLQ